MWSRSSSAARATRVAALELPRLARAVATWAITAIPVAGGIFALADLLFIFREDRRCLHDHIAGTRVVRA